MNPWFSTLNKTLSSMERARQQSGVSGDPTAEPPSSASGQTAATGTVPKGRTMLDVSRINGAAPLPTLTPPPSYRPPEPAQADPTADRAPDSDADRAADPPAVPAPPEPAILQVKLPETFPGETDPTDAPDDEPATPRTETAAVLRVRAAERPKPRPQPDDMVPMNFRLKLSLREAFSKTCDDRATTPSRVLRNMIKEYCGLLCLALAVVLSPAPATAQAKDSSYTTDQILAYLQAKAFGGAGKNIPGIRGTVAARHALWQTGAADPIDDFVYSDFSNTRLEAKIEIPIFDLSYLRNRDKEKLEHRTFCMKALSKILAAQKAVYVLESQISTVRQRRQYVETQVNLKLANRSDLFGIEDRLFSLQSQLYEAQSAFEQRVIELATLAENDWPEAYRMIIKWDGVLITQANKGGKK